MTNSTAARLLSVALVVTLAFTCVFVSYPQLDIAISRLFTDSTGRFFLVNIPWVKALNDILRYGQDLFFGSAILLSGIAAIQRHSRRSRSKRWTYFATVYLVGPGLIVNGILKSWVGRARPITITEFGGDRVFARMLEISDQCARNCSFSSGEVALTSSFVFALLIVYGGKLGNRSRYAAVFAGGMLICLSILLRIGLGRHFMSDTLSSVAISAFVTIWLARLFDVADRPENCSMSSLTPLSAPKIGSSP